MSISQDLEDELVKHYESTLRKRVETFTKSVARSFASDGTEAQVIRPLVVWRTKEPASLRRKLQGFDERDVRLTPESLIVQVPDLGGVRVIVHDRASLDTMIGVLRRRLQEGVWRCRAANAFAWSVEDREMLRTEEECDYLVNVRWSEPGSYRSRHFVVSEGEDSPIRCEVQFRTVLEEAIFEAHHELVYRPRQLGYESSEQVARVLGSMTQMFSVADDLLSDCYRWAGAHRDAQDER